MKILVVDDEKKIAKILSERLTLRGFDAIPVYDGHSALSQLEQQVFDGVVLDLRLPDIDGLEVLRLTMQKYPGLKVVILSGHGNEKDFETCRALGAIACFHKPANISKIIEALNAAKAKKK